MLDSPPLPVPANRLRTTVLAVHRDGEHRFAKQTVDRIVLEAGLGVAGDAHHGRTVQHRSRVKANPDQPNLRQVHLISESLFAHLLGQGFAVHAGDLGENITLASAPGLDWLALVQLPVGTQLHFSGPGHGQTGPVPGPVLELTGLRNPCRQIDEAQPGLLAAMLGRDALGRPLRKTGVMAAVRQGGSVQAGDSVALVLPPPPHRAMERV